MRVGELPDFIRQASAISFVIGAGASISAGIPAARGLMGLIEDKFSHCLRELDAEERKNYGRVMAALAPQERKELIEPLLERAKLNWGHVALASIVQQTNVKRVLTFNFDLLLEKAIGLLGQHLPVYDFGIAPASDVAGLADKAIFHLHGQSYGLKLLNSEDETEEHADRLRPVLSDSLRNHVTIVAGYSGGADGAFEVMKAAYNGANRLFWLGYSKEPSAAIKPLFEHPYAEYIGGCDFDLSMIEIARGLNCWPLPILDNPPQHVISQLKPLPDFPVGAESETAVLVDTLRHLGRLADSWNAGRSDSEREAAALMSGKTPEEETDREPLSEEAKSLRAWRHLVAAEKLQAEAEALDGVGRAEKFAEAYEEFAQAVSIKPDMHEAFNNWGITLSVEAKALDGSARAERFAEACEKYAQAVAIKPDIHEAFYNWGIALAGEAQALDGSARAERFAEAYEKYAQAVAIKPDYHKAFYNWGTAFLHEARALEGVAQEAKFAEAAKKFDKAKALSGKARFNLACVHSLTGKTDAALDELEACLRDGTLPDRAHLEGDADLDGLRGEARFVALLARADGGG